MFVPQKIMFGSAVIGAALVVLWLETFWRHSPLSEPPPAMSASELRTCGLGAVVCVGFGWHYFADGVGATGVASAVASSAQREAPRNYGSIPRRFWMMSEA